MTSKPTNTDSTKMENSPSVVSAISEHLPVAGDTRTGQDLVVPVGCERTIVDRQRQQVGDVAGIQRTRVQRICRGRVPDAHDRDAVDVDGLPYSGQLAVAAALRSEVDDHRPGSQTADHVLRHQPRCGTAWYSGGRDDHVRLHDRTAERLPLPREEVLRLPPRVAAFPLLRLQAQ